MKKIFCVLSFLVCILFSFFNAHGMDADNNKGAAAATLGAARKAGARIASEAQLEDERPAATKRPRKEDDAAAVVQKVAPDVKADIDGASASAVVADSHVPTDAQAIQGNVGWQQLPIEIRTRIYELAKVQENCRIRFRETEYRLEKLGEHYVNFGREVTTPFARIENWFQEGCKPVKETFTFTASDGTKYTKPVEPLKIYLLLDAFYGAYERYPTNLGRNLLALSDEERAYFDCLPQEVQEVLRSVSAINHRLEDVQTRYPYLEPPSDDSSDEDSCVIM